MVSASSSSFPAKTRRCLSKSMFSLSWIIFLTFSTVSVGWTSRETVFPYMSQLATTNALTPIKRHLQSQSWRRVACWLQGTLECHFMSNSAKRAKCQNDQNGNLPWISRLHSSKLAISDGFFQLHAYSCTLFLFLLDRRTNMPWKCRALNEWGERALIPHPSGLFKGSSESGVVIMSREQISVGVVLLVVRNDHHTKAKSPYLQVTHRLWQHLARGSALEDRNTRPTTY